MPDSMKIQTLYGLFAATVLLCGCSTPKFTEYHGTEVVQGKGGAVRAAGNIDIWESGDPDRKYKILGYIEESHGKGHGSGVSKLFSGSGDRDSTLAKVADKQGGDAVIIVSEEKEPSNEDADDDDGHLHRRIKKLIVIKYVD
jgi:hypothetical protein